MATRNADSKQRRNRGIGQKRVQNEALPGFPTAELHSRAFYGGGLASGSRRWGRSTAERDRASRGSSERFGGGLRPARMRFGRSAEVCARRGRASAGFRIAAGERVQKSGEKFPRCNITSRIRVRTPGLQRTCA